MFVISNTVAVPRIFHVLLPIWFLLLLFPFIILWWSIWCFSGGLSTVTAGPQWWIGIQNNNCSCSGGIILIPPPECFWGGEIKINLGLLFEVVPACMCCVEIIIICHVNLSRKWCCDWRIAGAGRWRHTPALKAKYLLQKTWFVLVCSSSLLKSCTRMFFQKRVLLQLQLHHMWLLTYRPIENCVLLNIK